MCRHTSDNDCRGSAPALPRFEKPPIKGDSRQIDFKYDRIESIEFGNPPDESVKETLEQFRTKTLPMIRSIASGCSLKVFVDSSHPHNLCDIIFDGLKECTGLSDIDLSNYGEKCQQFIRRQIEFAVWKEPLRERRLQVTVHDSAEITLFCH
ncbi:hypothetical protein QR680_006901 [Steinernema hermaphroditum]|uniref:Uncharacterized protein n=1 Tax=Steinernema hermaphroditum TaxID=289476 RepID=A0AA39HZ91_9BILA|nr:hypothetical protein QR680_006901 [Steinernema hermaphroditum]